MHAHTHAHAHACTHMHTHAHIGMRTFQEDVFCTQPKSEEYFGIKEAYTPAALVYLKHNEVNWQVHKLSWA